MKTMICVLLIVSVILSAVCTSLVNTVERQRQALSAGQKVNPY